ncbi:MAG: hypothetical protein V1930_01780 [Pseudomonadota bacterium]
MQNPWTPFFNGVTAFYEAVKYGLCPNLCPRPISVTDSLEIKIYGPDGRLKDHAVIDSDEKKLEIVEEKRQKYPVDTISREELALIRTLRLCGEEYKKRVYVATSVRAQRLLEEKRIETKEKLKAQKDMEILSTAAIE